jgi:4-aminobutyrate aminotransferase
VPPPEYFQQLKKLADKYGILLIDDEVQAGMGRTGKWCAIENWKVEPDVVCLAKSVASGLPLSAIVANAKVMDWEVGAHATTFGGNPVACAASLAVLEVIKNERLMENAVKQGNHIMKRLDEVKEKSEILGDVRGKGLMIGAEIVENKKTKTPSPKKAEEIMMRSWKRGIVVITCGKSTIRIAPPLTITKDLVDPALDIIIDTMKEVEKEK